MHTTINTTVRSYPQLPYDAIKTAILGKRYVLSLVFVGSVRARKLNRTYRNKNTVPNVLSFPLDNVTGEVFITPERAGRESKKFNMTPQGYVGYLFIHGLLHLKGYRHGATMEKAEKKYVKTFALK
jgi:probable rRNA maturation factor